jgi:hypothetical protein
MNDLEVTNRRLFSQWVRVTWGGWVLGVPLVIVLALIGEAIRIGGAQVLVGLGMGLGIGLLQGRAIRRVIGRSGPWFWSCVVGLAIPFLVADIAKVVGWKFEYSLQLSVACGGLIVGIWQAFLLRPRLRNTSWWVAASVAGWSLAAGAAFIADSLQHSKSLRGLWGAFVYLGIIAVGGLILGLVTGASLVVLRRVET